MLAPHIFHDFGHIEHEVDDCSVCHPSKGDIHHLHIEIEVEADGLLHILQELIRTDLLFHQLDQVGKEGLHINLHAQIGHCIQQIARHADRHRQVVQPGNQSHFHIPSDVHIAVEFRNVGQVDQVPELALSQLIELLQLLLNLLLQLSYFGGNAFIGHNVSAFLLHVLVVRLSDVDFLFVSLVGANVIQLRVIGRAFPVLQDLLLLCEFLRGLAASKKG